MPTHPSDRLARARLALEGLSVGDAFGEQFFTAPARIAHMIAEREPPAPPWRYTDDTNMALSIFAALRQRGEIAQDELARSFAERYDPARGYGMAMHGLLRRIGGGARWQEAAPGLFAGQGSYGNGAAMRVAPLGAYFADDLDLAAEQARRSAEVTHAHPEGVAGAVAVALAAAWAWRIGRGAAPSFASLLDLVLDGLPASEVRSRLCRAVDLSPGAPPQTAAAVLGNGSQISAQDTIPFALWCAASFLNDYPAALWAAASGLGDVDTNCAIVGGVVALATGEPGIPPAWRASREPLPGWATDGEP